MEKIIGPFESSKHNYITTLCLLAFKDDFFYIIKLDFVAQLKYAISLQLPFYYSFFEKLTSKTVEELKLKYKVTRFSIDDNFVGKIERSKLWKHKILITTKKEHFKFNILKRNKVAEYETLLLSIH